MVRFRRIWLCLLPGVAAYRETVDELSRGRSQSTSDTFSQMLQRMQENPLQVYTTLKAAVDATNHSIIHFRKNPPAVADGMTAIQVNMWKCVEGFSDLVDPNFRSTQDFANAKTVWDTGFTDATALAQSSADAFQADGNLTAFADIIDLAINISQNSAAAAMPELAPQFQAYGDLMRGTADAWIHYVEGRTERALESVWVAFNSSIVTMVGQERASQPEFKQTMEDLDDVVTSLIRNLINVRKSHIESRICYRQTRVRRSMPPTLCDNHEDWDFDGRSRCYPKTWNGADCGHACIPTGAECSSFCPVNKRWCCRKNDPNGPSECQFARFTDHSFTDGTAEDYFQCVAPVMESLAQESAEERPQAVEKPAVKHDVAQSLMARRGFQVANAAVQVASRQVTLDGTLGWKCWIQFWRRSCQTQEDDEERNDDRTLWGTHLAHCDTSTNYTTRLNNLCYPECKEGWDVVLDNGTATPECQQRCQGERSHAGVLGVFDPLKYDVCSRTQTELESANFDMVKLLENTGEAILAAVRSLQARKFEADILVKTIDAFGKMGQQFLRPTCDW